MPEPSPLPDVQEQGARDRLQGKRASGHGRWLGMPTWRSVGLPQAAGGQAADACRGPGAENAVCVHQAADHHHGWRY